MPQRLFRSALGRWLRSDCFACGRAPAAAPAPVCAACRADFFAPETLRCTRCGLRIPAGTVCGACLRRPPTFDATHACADYAVPMAAMIVAFKSHGRLELAAPLSELLAERAAALPAGTLITAVPLAFERLQERGFNQSDQLARAVARRVGLTYAPGLLVRVRHAPPQQSLALDARRRNVRGAYAALRALDGESVAVVDDVMTTGATLAEIAATLKRAGAARVTNLVLARTP